MEEIEITAWKEFAQSLRKRLRWDGEKVERSLHSALNTLPGLPGPERAELLELGRLLAERSSKLAVAFLRLAPQALLDLDSSLRPPFLRWAAVFASRSRETLIEFLEKSAGIIRTLPESERSVFLDLGLRLASQEWSVSFKYFVSLPQIQKEVPIDQLHSWFEEGLSLTVKSAEAGLAYFGLESQRSKDKVQEKTSAVSLKEVARPLKLFAQALTGKRLGLRRLEELKEKGLPLFGLLPCTDGEAIFLPEVSKEFSSPGLNFSAFKLATAHQAGYVEFGTFSFKLSSVQDLFPEELLRACLRSISDKGKPVAPLEIFFSLFPKKALARDLFQLLEGARIDHKLRREYRGLKKEMDLFIQSALKERPSLSSLPLQEAILESILRITVLEEMANNFPWPIIPYLENLSAVVNPLLRKEATVEDSARATVLLYCGVSALPNIRLAHLQAETEFEKFLRRPTALLENQGINFAPRMGKGEEPYSSPAPLPYRGQLRPELVQKKIRLREIKSLLRQMEIGMPLSAEALRELLEKGLIGEIQIFCGNEESGFQGLFLTDLPDFKKLAALARGVAQRTPQELKAEMQSLLRAQGADADEEIYYYNEWDYRISDYRLKWCRLKEKKLEAGSTDFVTKILESYADLVTEVRQQFQMLKPERFKKIPHLERGEEIDLNAVVEASVDRRAGHSPSEKIYIEKNRKERDFSTLFLLDMSASTDERVYNNEKTEASLGSGGKKVIDIEKEALVVMAEALKEIGDEYAIFGFSGYGRKEVEFYIIKDFPEGYGEVVKGRVGAIKPQRSTRMGPVIRHAVEKMAGREAKIKNLILISDGYPQDYDYGEERAGREYALQDTIMALEEAAGRRIHTFCITVDRAGHDYLRKMCHPSQYLVIEETTALPRELPKIYRRLTS